MNRVHKAQGGLLEHWLWAVPILLVVLALSLRQIDLYPPTADEFYSMFNSGWLTGPFSLTEMLQSMEQYSANHTPAYYVFMNLWGRLVGIDVAAARTPTIFAGLLALAMMFRLARDFVAPVAGLFALCLVASNAFYNYYYSHVRMYPHLLFFSTLVFWLYLRIMYDTKRKRQRDYLALGAASYLLANIHPFSALLFAPLAIYHLLLAPKGKRWTNASVSVGVALLLFSPWAAVLLTSGIENTFSHWQLGTATVLEVLAAWSAVTFNGSYLLPLISIAGLFVARRTMPRQSKHFLTLCPIFLAVFALSAHLTSAFGVYAMRLTLPAWPLTILFLVTGLYGLYRIRQWLGLLAFIWVAAGLIFQQTADWNAFLAGRASNLDDPPWHKISRIVQQLPYSTPIYSFGLNDTTLIFGGQIDYTQAEHYFQQHGSAFERFEETSLMQGRVALDAIIVPAFRLFFRPADVEDAEITQLSQAFASTRYRLCWDTFVSPDIRLQEYAWSALECRAPSLLRQAQTRLITLEHYGALVDETAETLTFVDSWSARQAFPQDDYRLAYQVISEDWDNKAQVDLELVHEGELRHFAIDISGVPAGAYRLMAVLYDNTSGKRVDWNDNPGPIPGMLDLADIVIPAESRAEESAG